MIEVFRMSSLQSIQFSGSQNEHWLHTCMCHTCIITFRFGLQASISMPSVNSDDSRCFLYHIVVHDYLTSIKNIYLDKGHLSNWC